MTRTPAVEDLAFSLIEPPERETFIATRYPFTYAYDFLRAHTRQFVVATPGFDLGVDEAYQSPQWSRAVASAVLRNYAEHSGQSRERVILAFAEAYLAEHAVSASEQDKAEALAIARNESWKSLGYDGPVNRS